MSKAFKLKNRYVLGLATWLNDQSLAGKDSRERTKFVTLLAAHLNETDKDRVELLKKYAEKDEKGEFKMKEENGKQVYDLLPDKLVEFGKEYSELLDEDFIIDILEGNKSKFETVKRIVLDTDYKFGPRENDTPEEKDERVKLMNQYDLWAEAFEEVKISD